MFSEALKDYDSLYVLATIMSGNIGGANNDDVFDSHIDTFNLSGAPNFQGNLDTLTLPEAIQAHQRIQWIFGNRQSFRNWDWFTIQIIR